MSRDRNQNNHKPWWEHEKVKLMLGKVYREKGMIGEFVDVICPLVRESLFIEAVRKKVSFIWKLCCLLMLKPKVGYPSWITQLHSHHAVLPSYLSISM